MRQGNCDVMSISNHSIDREFVKKYTPIIYKTLYDFRLKTDVFNYDDLYQEVWLYLLSKKKVFQSIQMSNSQFIYVKTIVRNYLVKKLTKEDQNNKKEAKNEFRIQEWFEQPEEQTEEELEKEYENQIEVSNIYVNILNNSLDDKNIKLLQAYLIEKTDKKSIVENFQIRNIRKLYKLKFELKRKLNNCVKKKNNLEKKSEMNTPKNGKYGKYEIVK